MYSHKYILEPYRNKLSRFVCPKCQKREKTFALYIDSEINEPLDCTVGRCNREINCGYHYTPKQYFEDNNINFSDNNFIGYPKKAVTQNFENASYIDTTVFKESLQEYDKNNLIDFFVGKFGVETTTKVIESYFIGTSKHWNGSTIFWQIDLTGKIRTGKIMLYSTETGKRIKEPFNYIQWVHSILKIDRYELKQCLFGEHLLKDKSRTVAIVESEKTAIICSLYFPCFIWLAVGSLTNLNKSKCEVLTGRNVVLFPDLNCFDKWTAKARELNHIACFKVSDLLERKATEEQRKQGLDIADYLLNFECKDFIEPQQMQLCESTINDYPLKNKCKYSEGSLEVYRIMQERKTRTLELTKEENYRFLQSYEQTAYQNFIDSKLSIKQILKQQNN